MSFGAYALLDFISDLDVTQASCDNCMHPMSYAQRLS